MARDDFCDAVTQTLPQCNTPTCIAQRLKWAIRWHIFWEGGKLLRQKVQIILFHADEKWFCALVIRMYGKICPGFGVQQVFNRIHHKGSIGKLLVICALAIIPHNNDLRQGGGSKEVNNSTLWWHGSSSPGQL